MNRRNMKISREEYTRLRSENISYSGDKEIWLVKEKSLNKALNNLRDKVTDCENEKKKAKSKRLKKCYELAIKMNDPMAAAQIASML